MSAFEPYKNCFSRWCWGGTCLSVLRLAWVDCGWVVSDKVVRCGLMTGAEELPSAARGRCHTLRSRFLLRRDRSVPSGVLRGGAVKMSDSGRPPSQELRIRVDAIRSAGPFTPIVAPAPSFRSAEGEPGPGGPRQRRASQIRRACPIEPTERLSIPGSAMRTRNDDLACSVSCHIPFPRVRSPAAIPPRVDIVARRLHHPRPLVILGYDTLPRIPLTS